LYLVLFLVALNQAVRMFKQLGKLFRFIHSV
jgi:hypothetical protein